MPDYCPDIVGNIHDLPFENDSLEAVICLAVLEHVENPFQATEEIYRTFKPGGYTLICVTFFIIIILKKITTKIIGDFLKMLWIYYLVIFLK